MNGSFIRLGFCYCQKWIIEVISGLKIANYRKKTILWSKTASWTAISEIVDFKSLWMIS
uniref:Uncharacterized protein n=1 Tax=Tetranychus urticae TaxID=32264 RepID=T1KXY6_TETUR